jgi:hypothetical protein
LRDDNCERWPIIAGVPYLRVGRQAEVERMLQRLDDGDEHGALLLALADQTIGTSRRRPTRPRATPPRAHQRFARL